MRRQIALAGFGLPRDRLAIATGGFRVSDAPFIPFSPVIAQVITQIVAPSVELSLIAPMALASVEAPTASLVVIAPSVATKIVSPSVTQEIQP